MPAVKQRFAAGFGFAAKVFRLLFVKIDDAACRRRHPDGPRISEVAPPIDELQEPAPEQRRPTPSSLNFHDLFKARAVDLPLPCQVVRPDTYGFSLGGRARDRKRQDKATTAWNFHTALYYKAGGVPCPDAFVATTAAHQRTTVWLLPIMEWCRFRTHSNLEIIGDL
ncbi:hypothetical protein [Bradyrhizobium sp. USDA 4451]